MCVCTCILLKETPGKSLDFFLRLLRKHSPSLSLHCYHDDIRSSHDSPANLIIVNIPMHKIRNKQCIWRKTCLTHTHIHRDENQTSNQTHTNRRTCISQENATILWGCNFVWICTMWIVQVSGLYKQTRLRSYKFTRISHQFAKKLLINQCTHFHI